jgi:mannan endo-1,4-beta-mannosidase
MPLSQFKSLSRITKTTNMKKTVSLSSLILLMACSKNETTTNQNTTETNTKTNVRSYMVDANATDQTVALFYNLKNNSKTKIAIGQQDAFNSFYENNSNNSDIKKTTGNDPSLLGLDFMFITDKNNNEQSSNWFYQQEQKIIQDAKLAYSKGMIVTFSWHLREPYNENSFYASDMSDTEKANAFKSILPSGANHNWYKTKLDKVASVLSNLVDANGVKIPVIFRPFHEFDGSWFWWGSSYCSADEYKQAYQFTVNYLKNVKNLHNVLYAFSPDNSYTNTSSYLSRYPGDAYVDILGMDNYGDLGLNQGQAGSDRANTKLKMISDLAISKVKIAALTETGYQSTASIPPIANWFSNYLYK